MRNNYEPKVLTPEMQALNFTIRDGLEVQRRQLARYEEILKPQYFDKLLAYCKQENEQRDMVSGFDVIRGVDLDSFINNDLLC